MVFMDWDEGVGVMKHDGEVQDVKKVVMCIKGLVLYM